jgi:transcriptional regulator with XRE-family HTH domain
MSDTRSTDSAGRIERKTIFPRAVVHKRILSVAEARPDASMEAVADDVTGATTSLVEQVLGEYGDPGHVAADEPASELDDDNRSGDADPSGDNGRSGETNSNGDGDSGEDADPNGDGGSSSDDDRGVIGENDDSTTRGEQRPTTDDDSDSGETDSAMSSHDNPDENRPLETADIPEKQLETLREIESRPNATQAELAERLGVTSATISQRVNGIDGFDWSERQTFVARLFDRSDLPLEPDDTNADGEAGTDAETDETASAVDEGSVEGAYTDGTGPDDAEPAVRACGPDADTAVSTSGSDVDSSGTARGTGEINSSGGDSRRGDSPEGDALEAGESADREGRTSDSVAAAHASDPGARDGGPSTGSPLADERASAETETNEDDEIDELTARVEALERQLASDQSVFADPELVHKVAQACLDSEQISDAEELRILKQLLTTC